MHSFTSKTSSKTSGPVKSGIHLLTTMSAKLKCAKAQNIKGLKCLDGVADGWALEGP
jgi:hypothetical protein